MVRVWLPVAWRVHAGGTAAIDLPAGTLRELLQMLAAAVPGLAPLVLDPVRELPEFLQVAVNGEDFRMLAGLDTRLAPGDEVMLLPEYGRG